jgi:hypothetical protein
MKGKFYQESGALNVVNLALGILIVLVLTCILSYIYALVVSFIPIIYFNFLIVIVFGVAISYIARFAFRIVKIRDWISRIIIVCLAVIFATYFQWAFFLDSLILDGYPSPKEYFLLLDWIFTPNEFFRIIKEVNGFGTWGIGSSGETINGWLLTLVWLGEIGISIFPSFKLLVNTKVFPFSEKYNKWYPKYTLEEDFKAVHSPNAILAKLEEDVVTTIKELGVGQARKFTKVHLFYISEEQNQYLSIETVFIEDAGEGKEERTAILDNYIISNAIAKDLKSDFSMTKESINVI